MQTDGHVLAHAWRYEDPETGIFEKFLDRRLGPHAALALLSGPLAERKPLGWVICPSIGPEHGNLRRLEAVVARRLAAAGFPVLRIRPDVSPLSGVFSEIELAPRLQEAEEAVEALRTLSGSRAVGALGVLFGGTVAALIGERLDLAAMALIEPVVRGRQYARQAMRRHAVGEMMAAAEVAAEEPDASLAQRPMHELSTSGYTTIRGLRLSNEAYEEISAVNLGDDLRSFGGRSLLVGVSNTAAVPPGLRRLRERLEVVGSHVTLEMVEDPLPAPLGDYYYRNVGAVRVDTRLDLDHRLAATITAWALAQYTVSERIEVA